MEKKKIMMKGTIFQLLWGHLKNNRQAQASGCGTGSLNTPKFGAESGFGFKKLRSLNVFGFGVLVPL